MQIRSIAPQAVSQGLQRKGSPEELTEDGFYEIIHAWENDSLERDSDWKMGESGMRILPDASVRLFFT
jgi:hypothetical protein